MNENIGGEQKTVLVDTSIIVDVDRGNKLVTSLCKTLTSSERAFISTVSVSEILTGSYLRRDYLQAAKKAERVLAQFVWVPLDGQVAKHVGEINAYLISKGLPIEYQDVAIAATCIVKGCDILLTQNKDHFSRIPPLRGRVMAPGEFAPRSSKQKVVKV